MSKKFDVIIIGAGCAGAFAAFYATQYKMSVAILEALAEPSMGMTKANSGIVHAGHNAAHNTTKAKLVDRGCALITELAPQMNFSFNRCGELVVARSEADFPGLDAMKAYSESINVPIEDWDEAKLRKEEPNLNPKIKRALFAPTAGVVNSYEMAVAAVKTAVCNGAKLFVNSRVIEIKKGEYFEIQTTTGVYEAKVVINAAGIYADEVARMVDPNTKISIKPRKGQEFILDKDFAGLVKRIIFPLPTGVTKGTLVIPTADGPIMCGPTAEAIDDKEDHTTTSDGMNKVFSMVQELVPSINPMHVIHSFAGCRAIDASDDFVIDSHDRWINAAGIQSPGLTCSPVIGQMVSAFANEYLNAPKNESWKIYPLHKRFALVDNAEKAVMAELDANHSKIICSCEMVTEADVQNAITDGAVTMDGVKIRTRAGMGRCQGGFCSTRVAELLAEREGVPVEAVTIRGQKTALSAQKIGSTSQLCVACPTTVSEYQPVSIKETQPITVTKDLSALNTIFEELKCDILIVGAGPAGLAAGLSAATHDKTAKILILERTERPGGILLQCIHGGFGLKRFGKELTGPEYSELLTNQAVEAGCSVVLNAYVTDIKKVDGAHQVTAVVQGLGMKTFTTRALITAVGCRERTRYAVRIQGTRPAGVYTAGLAQAMINLNGQLPGKNVVILGSGDIGLIMARRCTLEGAKVLGVYELLPRCSGLPRNVAQCLTDFNIPLTLSKTVVEIKGRNRVEAVVLAPCDPVTLRPDMTKTETIECDCLLLSVGLIPQTKLCVEAGGLLHERTRNPVVDAYRQIAEKAFACGNCLQVHDLADDAAEEGEIAGHVAIEALNGHVKVEDKATVVPSPDVLYVVPQSLYVGEKVLSEQKVSTRCAKPLGSITMKLFCGDVLVGEERVEEAAPAEMIHITVDQAKLHAVWKTGMKVELKAEPIVSEKKEVEPTNEKTLTCIVCPRGCKIHVKVNDKNEIEEIKGNSCPRGAAYARQEHIEPFRMFSTTVDITGCSAIKRMPVKLSKPVPRSRIQEVADEIKKIQVKAPVKMGDVIAKNVCGVCDIIACCSAK